MIILLAGSNVILCDIDSKPPEEVPPDASHLRLFLTVSVYFIAHVLHQ